MKEKVTNYEISKRLHDLGFKCQSHCGWWNSSSFWCSMYDAGKDEIYKAYDCWDLLTWLEHSDLEFPTIAITRLDYHFLQAEYLLPSDLEENRMPSYNGEQGLKVGRGVSINNRDGVQNTLGRAVIHLLEDKQGSYDPLKRLKELRGFDTRE